MSQQITLLVHLKTNTSFSEGNYNVWKMAESGNNSVSVIDSVNSRTYFKVGIDTDRKMVEFACPDSLDSSGLAFHSLIITWGNDLTTITVQRIDTKGELRLNKVDRITSECTSNQYPSAKAVYEFGNLKEITWNELRSIKNAGKIIPGLSYKITDYKCTTTTENTTAQSHVFDIIVQAIGSKELSENAKVMRKNNDSYFENSLLESWEIKYCLENNKTRFSWADTNSGRGVIYWMKDNNNNEAPYDFKNIQFLTKIGENDTWVYTFNINVEDNMIDGSVSHMICRNNVIKPYISDNTKTQILTDNFFLNGYNENPLTECSDNKLGYNCDGNTFGSGCKGNIVKSRCFGNYLGNSCSYNTLGESCQQNNLGYACKNNILGDWNCYNVLGNNCRYNTLGENCEYLSFSDNVKEYATVLNGTKATSLKTIEATIEKEGVSYSVGLNSMGDIKVWIPADSAL